MLWKMYFKKKITEHIIQINSLLIRPYISMLYTLVYMFQLEFAVLKRFDYV